MPNQKYLTGKICLTDKKFKLEIFLFLLFLVSFLILSQSVFGATLNLTATWTLNTEPDMKEYRLYRTDGTRTLLGTTPHPNNSYPFTVTVPDGSSGTLMFVVTAVDTSNNQSADSSPASYSYNLGTIPTVTITATDNTATEAGTTTGTFRVSRTGSTSGALTVYYTVSGTATPGSDYNSLSGIVTIASGSSTGTITVTPINDTVVESDETVIVTLSANSAYTVGSPSSATVTITSDDVAETVTPPTTPSLASSGGGLWAFYRGYSASPDPSNLYTGTSYKFSTKGSTSSIGSGVQYQFSWGDGTESPWSSPSRGSCSQSHTWPATGTYQVTARARSKTNNSIVSNWSNALSISVKGMPFIQITSPNGGENLAVGSTHTITWNSLYLNPTGTVYLFYKFDGAWHPIATSPPTATSFNWTIPRLPAGVTSPAPSSGTKRFGRFKESISIWIGNWVNGNWECYDKTDQSFRILYDAWVCKISGADQGGATLFLDEDSFEGYGISLKWGMVEIRGNYIIDSKGLMNGSYSIREFANPETVLDSGSLTGSVDSSSKKLTLNLTTSVGTTNISGVRFVSDPSIPGVWAGTLSGSASGSFASLAIDPYQDGDDLYSYVYDFLGSGSITSPVGGSINIEGNFYLTSTSTSRRYPTNVYGIYKITGPITDIGVLTGALNPSSGTFSFTMSGQDGKKYTLKGNAP